MMANYDRNTIENAKQQVVPDVIQIYHIWLKMTVFTKNNCTGTNNFTRKMSTIIR